MYSIDYLFLSFHCLFFHFLGEKLFLYGRGGRSGRSRSAYRFSVVAHVVATWSHVFGCPRGDFFLQTKKDGQNGRLWVRLSDFLFLAIHRI